ncbi:hypothetical protein NDU88_004714 [Pleurodeles waltl]|uniref:Uncharacterized protein n=1 Tax=Pleurodeles waltl TaxID=8319 RepID=A0AAV7PDA3_PLEWA|nr:hypothetical protein NDU88_004714 [Pleurodeles waltl]
MAPVLGGRCSGSGFVRSLPLKRRHADAQGPAKPPRPRSEDPACFPEHRGAEACCQGELAASGRAQRLQGRARPREDRLAA